MNCIERSLTPSSPTCLRSENRQHRKRSDRLPLGPEALAFGIPRIGPGNRHVIHPSFGGFAVYPAVRALCKAERFRFKPLIGLPALGTGPVPEVPRGRRPACMLSRDHGSIRACLHGPTIAGKIRSADLAYMRAPSSDPDHTRSPLCSQPAAVLGQPLRASHHHAIQTGRPTATAQAAMASGPSSPAGSAAATVSAPRAMPAVQAPRR